MKILHLTTSYFPRVGGIASMIRNIAHNTSDIYEHHLLCGCNGESKMIWMGQKIEPGIDRSDKELTVHRFKGSLFTNEMKQFLREFDYDLLLCYGYNKSVRNIIVDKKILLMTQNVIELDCSQVDHIWVYTESMKRLMMEGSNIPKEKISVMPIFINTDMYKSTKKGLHKLVYVGRFAPEKRIDMLIRVFGKLFEADYRYRLNLVGKCDSEKRDKVSIEKLSKEAQKAVTFSLAESEEELVEVYKNADIFVLPSKSETFGSSVLEALSSGLAVVATSTGNVRDWFSDYVTFVKGEDEMFEAIKKPFFSFEDKELHNKFIHVFSWQENKDRFKEMIEKCYQS